MACFLAVKILTVANEKKKPYWTNFSLNGNE